MTAIVETGRVMRPLQHLPWRQIAIGNLALIVPWAATSIVLGLQRDRLVLVWVIIAITVVTASVIVVPALRIRLELDERGAVSHRGRGRRVDRDRVRAAKLKSIYARDGIRATRTLFLLDHDGRTALRMSGMWWTDEQLQAVARHFEVPLEVALQPEHLRELRRSAPLTLRWAELHRIAACSIVFTITAALIVGFAALGLAAVR